MEQENLQWRKYFTFPHISFLLIDSMESVSVRKKGRYEAHDKVDQYLLLQICRHVQTDTLELLAEYLGVSEEQYVDTRTTQPANLRAQIMKVCKIEIFFRFPIHLFPKDAFARVFINPPPFSPFSPLIFLYLLFQIVKEFFFCVKSNVSLIFPK